MRENITSQLTQQQHHNNIAARFLLCGAEYIIINFDLKAKLATSARNFANKNTKRDFMKLS